MSSSATSIADPLAEALHNLTVTGTFYCRSEFSPAWGIWLPPMPGCLWFHVATTGSARLEVDGKPPLVLHPGEIALVPQGEGHVLRSDPHASAPDVRVLPHDQYTPTYAVLRHGTTPASGQIAHMVCAAVRFDHIAAADLLASLPRLIHIDASPSQRRQAIDDTLRLMSHEAADPRAGGATILTNLADNLVILALRSWVASDPSDQPERGGWLHAMRDPDIGRALTLVDRDPARAWTVEALASELAMSRSAFAARFTALVDEPVMTHVTRRRMQLALNRLRDDRATVASVADEFGYRSEAAFSRAFKRVVGYSPGAARRVAAEPIGASLSS